MTPEQVFTIATYGVLPAWLLLLVAPRWSVTQGLLDSNALPLALGTVYALCLLAAPSAFLEAGLAGFMKGFHSPWLAVAMWLHFLTFDLFVGVWLVRDARRRGTAGWVAPLCLVATLFFGPVGLGTYLVLRRGQRPTSLAET